MDTSKKNNKVHQFHSLRLHEYNYSSPGGYFFTICTKDRKNLFGQILDGSIELNPYGEIVQSCWDEIPAHFPQVVLDAFAIMPDHIHGIILINEAEKIITHGDSTRINTDYWKWDTPGGYPKGPVKGSIGAIVGSFKSAVTRQINHLGGMRGKDVWQRNYYEHIIRNDDELNQIRLYIEGNPLRGD